MSTESFGPGESFEDNRLRLERNLGKLSAIPNSSIDSPEGEEEVGSLQERLSEKFANYKDRIMDKLSAVGDSEVVPKVMLAAMSLPVLSTIVQSLRVHYPEWGAALDSAPEALQHIIHLDIWSHVSNFAGWNNGGIEINNLLADISSGKESISSLTADQVGILTSNLSGEEMNILQNTSEAASLAGSMALETADAQGLGNMGAILGAGGVAAMAQQSIAKLAERYK